MERNAINLNIDDLYRSLRERFYAPVPFPIKQAFLSETILSFFEFLNEPDAVKNHIDFSIAALHRRGEVGFRRRSAGDDIYRDNKEFFHFHPALFEKYENFIHMHSAVLNFVQMAQPIWDLSYQVVAAILRGLEPEFPGTYSRVFDTKTPHLVLRFLKYEWDSAGRYLAKPHYDAGSFTLAIAESEPGLRVGSCQENLRPVEHQEETALFMIASNFQKIINTDSFQPAWHDVIQMNDQLIGKTYARWAIVAFIDAHSVEALPRSETHKWYHEPAA